MDEQVALYVRLENGEIIPLQNSDIQDSSYVIQQPVDSVTGQNDDVDPGVAEPEVMEEADYESSNAEKVVYIVNQEGSNLDGMQFTVFGDGSTDGQTLTLQTIVSGDNSLNYTEVSNTLPTSDMPQSSLPSVQGMSQSSISSVQDMSAIEALSRIAVSEETGTQIIAADDMDGTFSNPTATDDSAAQITGQIDQSVLDNVNFTFYCQECGAASDNLGSLKQHLLNEHGILELDEDTNGAVTLLPSCTTCSKTFLDDNELNEHLKSSACGDSNSLIVAGADDSGSPVVSLPTIEHRCKYCTDKFTTRDDLREHIAASHPGKSLQDTNSNTNMFTKCPYCHKMYVHRGVNKALINHIILAHPDKHPLDQAKTDDKISCKFCGLDFYWKKSLIRHMKQSHPDEFMSEGEQIFTDLGVQEVQYPERRVRRSTKSVQVDDDIIIMKCPSCPKTFLWEKSLKKHMTDVHKVDEPSVGHSRGQGAVVYKCPYCSQVSKYACSVRKHVIRKHKSLVKNVDVNKMTIPKIQAAGVEVKTSDTRPVEVRLNLCHTIYRCPYCIYASKQPSNLNRHLTSKMHGHIFTSEELKAIGLNSFKVQKRPSNRENQPEKIDGTTVSTLPKLRMKRSVLDIVMEKYEILKQRNLADKENTITKGKQEDYNELDIENIIAVAEEESEESFDEDDDSDVTDTQTELDVVGDKRENNAYNGDVINDIIEGSEKCDAVESASEVNCSSNSEVKEEKQSKITEKVKKTSENKDHSAGDNKPVVLSVKCILCQKRFKNFTQFQKHSYTHVNLKLTFDCMVCQEKFSLSKDILKHLRKKHGIQSTEIPSKSISMSKMADNRKLLVTYDCPYCDVLFSQSDPLYKHVVDDHSNCIDAAGIKSERGSIAQGTKQVVVTAYRCQFCECSFHNITDIVKHMGIIHGDVEKVCLASSSVRKSARKRKIPKWLEDEIELTPTSKRSKVDEETDDDLEDWNKKPVNVSPRKKTAAKSYKTNTKSANISAKKDVVQISSTSNDQNSVLKEAMNVSEVTEKTHEVVNVPGVAEKPVTTKSKYQSKPVKPKSVRRKTKVDESTTTQTNMVNSTTMMLNKCPHCDFTAKRASALTFHINFNHSGVEIKEEPQDPADESSEIVHSENAKNIATREIKNIENLEKLKSVEMKAGHILDGTEETITVGLEDFKIVYEGDDLLDEDIDFGDSDDDFMPFERNKDGHIGFSASVKLGCPYCNNGFFSTLLLVKKHIEEKHPEYTDTFSIAQVKTKVEIDNEDELTNVLHTCHHCKKKVRGNSELETHIKAEHPELKTHTKAEHPIKLRRTHIKAESNDGVTVKFTTLDKKLKSVLTSDGLPESITQADDKYSYRCTFCSKQFDVAENAVKHVHESHWDKKQVTIIEEICDKEGFMCPYCNMKSKYKRCIVRHVSRAHKDEKNFRGRDIIVIGNTGTGKTTYFQCSFCGFESKYKSSVDQHTMDMHPNENVTVTIDKTSWNSLDYLINKPDGVDYYKCRYCDTVYETQAQTLSHISADHDHASSAVADKTEVEKVTSTECLHDGLVYLCPVCNQGSKWLLAVVQHMKIAHQELTEYRVERCKLEECDVQIGMVFRCEVCNAVFNTRRGMLQHSKTMHGKEENYRVVYQENIVDNDMQVYCCPYCKYRANLKRSIIKHVGSSHPDMKHFKVKDIIHVLGKEKSSGEVGAYKCPYCNVVNHWRKSIIRHIRTMHQGLPYDVDIRYQKNAALPGDVHSMRKNSKLIECLLCGTLRRSTKTMKQHFQAKHRKHANNFLNKEFTNFKYAKAKLIDQDQVSGDRSHMTYVSSGGQTLDHGCVLCGAKYVWKKSLLVHIKNQHRDMYDVYRSMDQMVDIVCQAAESVDKEREVYIEDVHSMLDDIELKPKTSSRKEMKRCRKCQKTVATPWAGKCHRKIHHQVKRSGRFSCTDCCLSFSTGSKLRLHKIIHHKYKRSGSWHCTGCNYRCKFWSVLRGHFMKKHAPKHIFSIDRGVYKCEVCSKVFATSRFLKQHLTMHRNTKKPSYQCSVCQQQFVSIATRDIHTEVKHPDLTEMCECCGDMISKRNLKMHMRTHSEPHLLVACPFCKKSVMEKTLNRHVLTHHDDLVACYCDICTSDVNTCPEGSYKCKICRKNTCHNLTLLVHTKLKHSTASPSSYKIFQCGMCPEKVFASKHLWNVHCHKHHRKEPKQSAQSITRQSNILNEDPTTHVIHIGQDEGKQFLPKLSETSMNAVLKELIVFERGLKDPHKCLLCGRSFSKLKYIKLHVRRAHVRDEDQPYRCKVCGSGFVRLTEFRKHTRSHSDFRPYKCTYCDKAFKQQANLTDHYRVHANTKNYECFICKTTFRQRGGLTSHVVFHDTLKPYKCMFCSKGYTTRGELSRHMQKYNRDGDGVSKSYQCHLCDDTFPHYPMLMKHIELHSPEKPFECQMCKAQFSSYVSMYFHKVDNSHFYKEDIEQGIKDLQQRGRKFRAKKMESQLLLRDYDRQEAVNQMDGEIMYVNQADDGSLQTEAGVKPVEIIIEEFGKDHVVHVQDNEPEHEELLSIAKQLTELSAFKEQEVQTSAKKNIYQEEDEIIKHMLDADEDVLASLNKPRVVNNRVMDRTIEQVGNIDIRNDDSFQEMDAEEIVEDDGEQNVSYVNQTLPTTMEELVSIVSQNVTTDGNDQVIAYQNEDGSMMYVCLSEGDNKAKEIELEPCGEVLEYSGEVIEHGGDLIEHGGEVIEHSGEVIEHCGEVIEHGGEMIEHSGEVIEHGGEVIKHSGEVIEHGGEVLEHGGEVIEHSGEIIEHSGDVIEHSETAIEHGGEVIEHSGEAIEHGGEVIEHGGEVIEDNGEVIEHGEEVIEHGGEVIEHGGEVIEHGGEMIEHSEAAIEHGGEVKGHSGEVIEHSGEGIEYSAEVLKHGGEVEQYLTEAEKDEVCDNEDRNETEGEENFIVPNSMTSDIPVQGTSQVRLISSNGVQYVQISAEDLQQVSANEIPINQLHLLQTEMSGDSAKLERRENDVISNDIQSFNTSEITVPQNKTFSNEETIVHHVEHGVSVDVHGKFKDEGNVQHVQIEDYTGIEQSGEQYQEMVEDAEESREALLRRSQLAQHLTGNIPLSNPSSVGSTHMVFTGAGIQTITRSSTGNVYANSNSESLETDNVSQSLINIAAAAEKIENNGKQHDVHNVSDAADVDNINTTEGAAETVLEYQISEARFIKEELLDPSYSGVGEEGAKAAAEVMFVSDNIYTYSQPEKKFICLHCGQKIKSFKNLKNHIRRHAPESARVHKCTYCEKRFVTKNEVKRHIWTHTGERNYECKHCGKKFIQPGHLSEHVRLHTGKKPFRCNSCKQAFNTQSQLKLHWSRRHSDNKIPCPQCDRTFKNNIDLTKHKGLHHSGMNTKIKKETTATSPGDHVCDICGLSFMKKTGLKLHLEKHNLENSPSEEKEVFACDICGSTFKSKYYATEHVKSVHSDETNEVCETCGMAFKTKALLRRHKDKLHSESDSKWQCKTCNKSFASKSALGYHIGSKH